MKGKIEVGWGTKKDCKHLNTEVYGTNRIGHGTCLDCKIEVHLSEVFTNWIKEFQKWKKAFD
jgi:hypothetical protein